MSDWELVDNNQQGSQPQQQQAAAPQSDWSLVDKSESPEKKSAPTESYGQSMLRASPRMAEDIYKHVWESVRNIPNVWETAKTEVPGLIKSLKEHPQSVANQAKAGFAEKGMNSFNLPHDIANYASERLHLIPENINKNIQMGRMPEDTKGMINQQWGEPKYPGEKLARGTMRNISNIPLTTSAMATFNPLRLKASNIAKEVVKEGDRQYAAHGKSYDKLWNTADRTGHSQVPVDMNKLSSDFVTIEKYKTPREYEGLVKFANNPTLRNAQKAQADMNIIHRNLEKKSRTSSLTSEEKALYDSAKSAEKEIENNMFKNQAGDVNNKLKSNYDKITNSYRENVVPYKYNPHIQAFKNKEMLPKELVNALSHGDFAAKKGHKHYNIALRNLLGNYIKPVAIGAGGMSLYQNALGTKETTDYNK
jgi:hypothetical protein